METKVYYGEYSLRHWIDLILSKNVVLPPYQRRFVWKEKDSKEFIDSLSKKEFVPSVTIGVMKNNSKNENIILDGQQRLTTILLAFLNIFPKSQAFKDDNDIIMTENDLEEEDTISEPLKWTFKELLKFGESKKSISEKLQDEQNKKKYSDFEINVDEHFFDNTYIGFSYIVPISDDENEQKKYYSSVFINIHGVPLTPQESREALYYLNADYVNLFEPHFSKRITLNKRNQDFVRYLSLLAQYKKDGNVNTVAKNYKSKMELYYEEYIYAVIDENKEKFDAFFKDANEVEQKIQFLEKEIKALELEKNYTSIIDLDTYMFGIIYWTLYENKKIDEHKKRDIQNELEAKISEYKAEDLHTNSPNALKYLRTRINESINIYSNYIED